LESGVPCFRFGFDVLCLIVLDLFQRLNQEHGQTIVMVSHEPWHEDYFDRVIRFVDGNIDSGYILPDEE